MWIPSMPWKYWAVVGALIALIGLGIFFWWRARNRDAKGRFALALLYTVTGIFFTGVSSVGTNLPGIIITEFLKKNDIIDKQNEYLAFLLSCSTLILCGAVSFFLMKYGQKIIRDWNGPIRLSDMKVSERGGDAGIAIYALSEIDILRRMVKDSIADESVSKWKDKPLDPPQPKEVRLYVREVFLARFPEAEIPLDGWRGSQHLWRGSIKGGVVGKENPLVLFVVENNDIEQIDLPNFNGMEDDAEIYAVIDSDNMSFCRTLEHQGRTVHYYSTSTLLVSALDLRPYAKKIINSYDKEHIAGTGVTLSQSFVSVNAERENGDSVDLLSEIKDWENSQGKRHLAIIGDYGQGKSTVCLKFCADWAFEYLRTGHLTTRIPLLIELRGHSPGDTPPVNFLGSWSAYYGLNANILNLLIQAGGATLIFEGFDELKKAGRDVERLNHFRALWKFAHSRAKIIFTGRPNFFLDESEANTSLKNEAVARATGEPYTSTLKLMPMTIEQIEQACRGYDAKTTKGIVSFAKEDKSFFEVISRPSMLPVVATIWDEIQREAISVGTLSSATVIDMYISTSLRRKEAELERDRVEKDASDSTRYLYFPLEVRQCLTEMVCWHMACNNLANTVSRTSVKELFVKNYSQLLEISSSAGSSRVLADGFNNFERLHSDLSISDKAEIMTTEVCSSGLLINDPATGEGFVRFAHKQFYEFLVANAVVRCIKYPNDKFAKLSIGNLTIINAMEVVITLPVSCKFLCQMSQDDLIKLINVYERMVLLLPSSLISLFIKRNYNTQGLIAILRGMRLLPLTRITFSVSRALVLGVGVGIVYSILTYFIAETGATAMLDTVSGYVDSSILLKCFISLYGLWGFLVISGTCMDRSLRPISKVLMWGQVEASRHNVVQIILCAVIFGKNELHLNGGEVNTKDALQTVRELHWPREISH